MAYSNHCFPSENAIDIANEIFGLSGWNSAIRDIPVDFVQDHLETKRVSVGISAIVRVTRKDGTYHEAVGYGQIKDCESKARAFAEAKR